MDHPEAFGQHPNADIASQITETRTLLETLLSLQPQVSASGSGQTVEEKVLQLAGDVLSKVPDPLDYDGTAKILKEDPSPVNVVLLQEVSLISTSLIDKWNVICCFDRFKDTTRCWNKFEFRSKICRRESKGWLWCLLILKKFSTASTKLEFLHNGPKYCINFKSWYYLICTIDFTSLQAYPTMKPLGSWTRDLIQRIDFYEKWCTTAKPPSIFWLAAFTFPTGFLTALLQTAARQNNVREFLFEKNLINSNLSLS